MIDFKFFSKILGFKPTYTRNEVMVSADKTREIINNHTLPCLQGVSDVYASGAFKNDEINAFCKIILRDLDGKNAFQRIQDVLNKAVLVIDYCAENSQKIFSSNEASAGMTFAKFTMLRTIQVASFASEYSRKFCNWSLAKESEEFGHKELGVSKNENTWIRNNFDDFMVALNALNRDVSSFKSYIDGLPDAIISEATERTFSSTLGDAKTDPMNIRGFSVEFNPFYFLGMVRANWQAKRYEAAEQDLTLIQMRVMQLQAARTGDSDARLEKQIAYHQERATAMMRDIDEMRRDYKLGE